MSFPLCWPEAAEAVAVQALADCFSRVVWEIFKNSLQMHLAHFLKAVAAEAAVRVSVAIVAAETARTARMAAAAVHQVQAIPVNSATISVGPGPVSNRPQQRMRAPSSARHSV